MREDANKEIYVQDLTMIAVKSITEIN